LASLWFSSSLACRSSAARWRVSSSRRTDFVLDALEQAIYERCSDAVTDLIHHTDRGSQYLSMRYTDRLADAGINPSVGSRGDCYHNAGRIGDRTLQNGGDSTKRTVAACRGRRIRRASLGRLVQQPSLARTHWPRTASGIRSAVL
jgi:hypothetical protein